MPARANAQTKGTTMTAKKTSTKKTVAKKVLTDAQAKALENAEPKPISNAIAQRLMARGLMTREQYEIGLDSGAIRPERHSGFLAEDDNRRAVTKLWKQIANWNASTGSEIGAVAMLRIQYNQNGKDRSLAVNDKKLGVNA